MQQVIDNEVWDLLVCFFFFLIHFGWVSTSIVSTIKFLVTQPGRSKLIHGEVQVFLRSLQQKGFPHCTE